MKITFGPSFGHFALIAGMILCMSMFLVACLLTDCIDVVSGSPFFLLFDDLCAGTMSVNGNIPDFRLKNM